MYQKGDLVVITEKENSTNYMFGMVIKLYDSGVVVLSLDQGTFNDNRFKKNKKLGIKYSKYIRFDKYNIYVSDKAEQYYSVDYTNRTIDRKYKHITYKIKTEYYEYFAIYTDKDNKNKMVAYTFINKKKSNSPQILTSGGLFIASANVNNANAVLNKARARAEVNLYKQFSCEND